MLSRDQLHRLLEELAAELHTRHVSGELFVVGGAAIALVYNHRRITEDLDAVFEPKAVVYDAARAIAERHGLPPDWLNNGVKAYLPGDDPNATLLFDRPGLAVRVASPRYLFVMKALAARVERDEGDLRLLFTHAGFESVEEALDAVQAAYPVRAIPPRTQYLLREILAG